MEKRVVVLGANGFIGSRLVQELRRTGFKVEECYLRRVPGRIDATIGFEEETFSALLQPGDTLVSCLPSSSPFEECGTSRFDSVQFLEWLVGIAHRRGVQRIAFCSSGGAVYGNANYLPISETHPTQPISAYGRAKLEAEVTLVRECEARGIFLTIWRFSNLFGFGQTTKNGQGLLAHLEEAATTGRKLKVFGSGEMVRDYLDVADAAKAAALTLMGNPSHTVYNVGSESGRSVNEVIEMFESVVGKKIEMERIPVPPGFVNQNILSIGRLRHDFPSFSPVSLEVGIASGFSSLAE